MSFTLDKETAEISFEIFAERWRIGRKIVNAKQEVKEEFEEKKQQIIAYMQEGLLVYNESDDTITLNVLYPEMIRNKKQIIIKRPRGGMIAEGDKYGEKEQGKKLNAYLSHMTGEDASLFVGMDYLDAEIITAVMTLFLAS